MGIGTRPLGVERIGGDGGVAGTSVTAGLVTETDTALAAVTSAGAALSAGLVTETDTARATALVQGFVIPAGIATETDTSLAVTLVEGVFVAAGLTSETDTAQSASVVAGATLAAGLATEADTALGLTIVTAAYLAAAVTVETDTALSALAVEVWTVGIAVETDAALHADAGLDITRAAGLAAETDTALAATIVVSNLPHETDLSNRADGIEIEAYADADWEPGVVARPALVPASRVDLVVVVVDSYDRTGGFPRPVTREVRRIRERTRITVGGQDWTFREDVPALTPDYILQVPLLYGPATWAVPQFDPRSDDKVGVGRFKRIKEQNRVLSQRVDDDPDSGTYGQVTTTDWIGFVQGLTPTDPTGESSPRLDVELAGEAHGRAVMAWHAEPLVVRARDIGTHVWNSIVGKLGRRMTERIPHIGINLSSRGGTYEDEYLNEQLAMAVDRDTGEQWTVMPSTDPDDRLGNGSAAYELRVKDYETVHFTIYRDGQLNKGTFITDLAERLNMVYADAIAPDGHRINFSIAPRILRGSVPPYPFEDGRTFGIGTTDTDTDTGDGITALIWRLTHLQRLHRVDLLGGYDEDVFEAVAELRDDARMLPPTGNVTLTFWNQVLWDNLAAGYSDEWAHIRPAVQRSKTRKFLRSGSGAIIGRNPDYDEHEIVRAAAVSMGQARSTRQVIRAARDEMAPLDVRDWLAQYELDGGVVLGEHNPGDPIDASMIADPRDVLPGMNVWDPWHDGGTLFQVSQQQPTRDGKHVSLMADTRARDTAKVWEIWDRARETRENLARGRGRARASMQKQDTVAPWDQWSGQTDRDWDIVGAEWTEIIVPTGGAGTLNDIDIQLAKPHEFAVIVSPNRLPRVRLNRKIEPLATPPPDPQRHHLLISGRPTGGTYTLDCDGDETTALAFDAGAAAIQAAIRATGGAFAGATVGAADGGFNVAMGGSEGNLNVGSNDLTGGPGGLSGPTMSVTTAGPTTGDGAPWYGQPALERWLKKEHGVLYTAGWVDQPCGYGAYVKNDGNGPTAQPLSGHHTDTAGVEYTVDHNTLFLYIWDQFDNRLPRQQVFEQQISGV